MLSIKIQNEEERKFICLLDVEDDDGDNNDVFEYMLNLMLLLISILCVIRRMTLCACVSGLYVLRIVYCYFDWWCWFYVYLHSHSLMCLQITLCSSCLLFKVKIFSIYIQLRIYTFSLYRHFSFATYVVLPWRAISS